jgi:hypothetical protein
MSGAAAWKALIEGLTSLVDGPTDQNGDTPAYEATDWKFGMVTMLPPKTSAAWEILILETKVCGHVCTSK